MFNDIISDLATRIRNASLVGKKSITIRNTKLVKSIADVMVETHYLKSVNEIVDEKATYPKLEIELNYVGGKPAVNSITRISKPGVRIYKKKHELHKVLSGLGIYIISTSRGVMSNATAIKQNLGGEVLLELW